MYVRSREKDAESDVSCMGRKRPSQLYTVPCGNQ